MPTDLHPPYLVACLELIHAVDCVSIKFFAAWDGFSTASDKTWATPESIATSAPSRIRFASSNSSAALESWFGARLVVFFPITDSTIKKWLAAMP